MENMVYEVNLVFFRPCGFRFLDPSGLESLELLLLVAMVALGALLQRCAIRGESFGNCFFGLLVKSAPRFENSVVTA